MKLQENLHAYIGVEWNKNLGNTNDISSLDEVYAVAGVKFWF